MSERYIVSGATGFLGGRLTEMLRAKGKSVLALGRDAKKGARLEALGAEFHSVSLHNRKALEDLISENSIVVHCAALSSPWGKETDFYQANVLGTRSIGTAALTKKVARFVHISTPSIYVDRASKLGIKESDPLPKTMINLYAQSKFVAEKEIDLLTELGLPAITLRPQGIFGPNDPSILPRLIRVAKKGFIPVIGEEKVKIDLTYVDNVVDAILAAAEAGAECIGKKYNITNGEPILQHESLHAILERLGFHVKDKNISLETAEKLAGSLEFLYRNLRLSGEPLLTQYSVYTLAFSRTLDISRARAELHYEPKVSFQDGIERYVQWYNQSVS
jgi:nucleoside-diphosphate-sugar epimerase